MRLNCELEVVYSLAVANGGVPCRSSRSRAALSLGKKPSGEPRAKGGPSSFAESGGKKEEIYLVVSTAKNVAGTKYRVSFTVSLVPKHSEREREESSSTSPLL